MRDDLRGQVPYGAPQLDVRGPAQREREPVPAVASRLVADVATAVAEATRGLNRYPDRDAVALRADLAAYLGRESGVALTGDQVWAANGINEVMHQLLQAFGGPGRTALGFAPTYSMYPEYCRDTFTGYVTMPARRRLPRRRRRGGARDRGAPARHRLLASPNNPTGTPLAARRRPSRARRRAGHGRRRRGVRRVPPRRHAERARAARRPPAARRHPDDEQGVRPRRRPARLPRRGAGGHDAVQLVRLPYHLSAVTQAVARTALAHADELLAQVALLRAERDALVDVAARRGLDVADSDANFVLFGHFADRHAVWQGLLDRAS